MLLMDMFMADRRATGIPIPAEAVPTAVSVSAVTTMASTIIPISERAVIPASATAEALVMAAASEVADKYALKGFAICQHALKGQKLLAQGIALGYSGFYEYALKGQKLYKQLKLEII